MEQWYKDGIVLTGNEAIRMAHKEVSLPLVITDLTMQELGYVKVVDIKPTVTSAQYLVEGSVTVVAGVPAKQYTVVDYTAGELAAMQTEAMAKVVQHFTDVTTAYIEGKVQAYNVAHGLAFKDIDAFTKYAVTPTSVHNAIANQFISYADRLWTAVRTYQAAATAIPTDVEFKAVLDGVVF